MKQLKEILGRIRPLYILTAYLFAALLEQLLSRIQFGDPSALQKLSLLRMGILFLAALALETALNPPEQLARYGLGSAAALLVALTLRSHFAEGLMLACGLVLLGVAVYIFKGYDRSSLRLTAKPSKAPLWAGLTAGCALVFLIVISVWSVCRVRSFVTPTFDFGLFSQMFHYMRTTGQPLTTLERDGLLSHFAVHISPIYYLFLPFFTLIPRPETLQVLQAAVLASGVIPLWRLTGIYGLKPPVRFLLCLLLLLYPAYGGGVSYDLHENAFLTPLILWLLYAVDRRLPLLTVLSALGVLFVKEDAPVYVAVIGLYALIRGLLRRKTRDACVGGLLFFGSLIYFLLATAFLSGAGDGVMTERYSNFSQDGSLLSVVKNVILCPMGTLFECMDPEKLSFIALTMLPLLGLPLITRRYERYVLLIPYFLVNLMPDYQYQHDIFFQYTYGPTAFLFYLTVANLADLKVPGRQLMALLGAAVLSYGSFTAQVLPKVRDYWSYATTYEGYYSQVRAILDAVPQEDSVAATTYLTTHLSQRDQLYDLRYCQLEHLLACKWFVLDAKSVISYKSYILPELQTYEDWAAVLQSNGFTLHSHYNNRIQLWTRP